RAPQGTPAAPSIEIPRSPPPDTPSPHRPANVNSSPSRPHFASRSRRPYAPRGAPEGNSDRRRQEGATEAKSNEQISKRESDPGTPQAQCSTVLAHSHCDGPAPGRRREKRSGRTSGGGSRGAPAASERGTSRPAPRERVRRVHRTLRGHRESGG